MHEGQRSALARKREVFQGISFESSSVMFPP